MDIEDYTQRYAAQYAEGGFETVLVAVRRRQVLESIAGHPHRHVLEIGCGLEPLFASGLDFDSFTVVEPSEDFVANARSVAAGRSDIDVRQGYLEDVAPRLQGRPFDFVIASSLLHEVQDPIRFLRAVRSVCGPETVIHLNVPNVRSFHRLLALEMGLIESVFEQSEMERRFQRRTRFDLDALRAMMTAEGMDVIRDGSYLVKPFTHAQMEAMIAAGIVDGRVLAGLERMVAHLPGMGCEIFVEARLR
jgi:SAM-dependent methyltransferase